MIDGIECTSTSHRKKESTRIVQLLLRRGANPNLAKTDGFTALHAATMKDSCEIAGLLLASGAQVNAICQKGERGARGAVVSRLGRGANPNTANMIGYTALHFATMKGTYEIAELLLSKEADANAICEKGTPLHIAAEHRKLKLLKLLLQHGANANISDTVGRRPIELAAVQGCKECVETLFSFTTRTDWYADWSIDGIIQHAISEDLNTQDPPLNENGGYALKAQGDAAFGEKDYAAASSLYTKAMETCPDDSTLYAKRSLCWLHMNEKGKAVEDANICGSMERDVTNSWYEQATALILSRDYDKVCEALVSGLKLDFGSDGCDLTGEASRKELP